MFIVGIGSVSAESIDEIGISSSDDVTDDIVAVSDDVSVDDVVAEVDSVDDSIAASNDEILESVDDSGNESLAVQDKEPVNDVEEVDPTLAAVNDNGETLGIDPKDLSNGDFATPDTIYYLNEGTYNVKGSPVMITINNIAIKPNDNANVVLNVISTGSNPSAFMIAGANNITIENIKFTGSQNGLPLFWIIAASNVTIRNCTFENVSGDSICQIANGKSDN